MADIEDRVESTMGSKGGQMYVDRAFTAEDIKQGRHRAYVGGHWDTHGRHQLDFLVAQGLQPRHSFLDVGCGCFRAGRFLIDYLDPGNYYGIDSNLSVLSAGYDYELTDAQRDRLPTTHLIANERFNTDFGVKFDMAIAQSVFTHVSLNHIRLCLYRVAKVMQPGGKFFATYVERPPHTQLDKLRPGASTRFTERNPFWYYRSDIAWAAKIAPWKFRYIGDWGHPTGQMMLEFSRLDDAEIAQVAKPVDRTKAQSAQSKAERIARANAERDRFLEEATSTQIRLDQAKRLLRRSRRWAARHIDPDRPSQPGRPT